MKQALQNLLAEGKIAQVIAQLRQVTQQDTDLHNEVLHLSARFAENERKRYADTLDNTTLGIEQNKINAALLAVINQLDGTPISDGVTPSHTVTNNATPTIVQNADKIYNIDHIDNANFS